MYFFPNRQKKTSFKAIKNVSIHILFKKCQNIEKKLNNSRAKTCKHLQCFDASLYLQMNERKPTWNCPVCDKPALYETLVIDGYAIFAQANLGPAVRFGSDFYFVQFI